MASIVPTSASSTFPGCALSCSVLLQSQNLCYPPNVPEANQQSYNQCFCNIGTVNPFYSSPDVVCAAECSIESDRLLLQNWYKNFCQAVSQGQDPTGQTQNGGTTTITSTATGTLSTQTPGASYTGAVTSEGGTGTVHPQNWIQSHWKWILMIGILIVAFAAITVLLIWLKRRHRRKIDERRKAASGFTHDSEKRPAGPKRVATPELWGPHQMMQHTQGYQYSNEAMASESSKRPAKKETSREISKDRDSDHIEVAEAADRTLSPSRNSRRARPSELENNARLIGAADRLRKSKRPKVPQLGMSDKEIEASLQGKQKSKQQRDDYSEKT